MKTRIALLLLAFLSLPASVLAAQGNYTENLLIKMPAEIPGWHLDKQYDLPNNWMMEYVPGGQTGQNWSEIITTITMKNRPNVNTGQMILNIVKGLKGRCGSVSVLAKDAKKQTDPLRESKNLPATYQTYSMLVRCDNPGNANSLPGVPLKKYEVVWFKGMQGWLTSYLVQRAWHGDEITPGSILASTQTMRNWQDWADSVGISSIPDSALH